MSEALIPIALGAFCMLFGLALMVPQVTTFSRSLLLRRTARLGGGPEGRVDVGSAVAAVLGGGFFLAFGIVALVSGSQRPAEKKKEDLANSFIAAAERGDVDTVRRMLARQPDLVNAMETNAWVKPGTRVPRNQAIQGFQVLNRPLHAAAKGLQADVVKLLLDRGADASATIVNRVTALHTVGEKVTFDNDEASARRVKIIELLIARGAKVNARSKSLKTPLHANAYDAKAIELLLAHGADVNARDGEGRTPLIRAAAIGAWDNTEAVQSLLDHGSDANARDHDGNTALLLAAGKLPTLELLLSRGASARIANDAGATPLHMFATYDVGVLELRNLDALALLCSSGLRANVRDHAGKTALDIARESLAAENDHPRRKAGIGAIVRFLSPGGSCDRFARDSPPTKEERKFIVSQLACAEGDAEGCARLGWCYDTGTGVPANRTRAAGLYKPACDAGGMWACFNLALLYASGDGVPKDRAAARTLFRKACDGGDADSCHKLRSGEWSGGL
jgi:ankyrin repeat protein